MRLSLLPAAALLISSAAFADLDPAVKEALDQGCPKVAKENPTSPCRGVANLVQFKLIMAHVKFPEAGHDYCMQVCEKMRTDAGLPHIPAPGEPGAKKVEIPKVPTVVGAAPTGAAAAPAASPDAPDAAQQARINSIGSHRKSPSARARRRFDDMMASCERWEAMGRGKIDCDLYLDKAMESAKELNDQALIDQVEAKRKALGITAAPGK